MVKQALIWLANLSENLHANLSVYSVNQLSAFSPHLRGLKQLAVKKVSDCLVLFHIVDWLPVHSDMASETSSKPTCRDVLVFLCMLFATSCTAKSCLQWEDVRGLRSGRDRNHRFRIARTAFKACASKTIRPDCSL